MDATTVSAPVSALDALNSHFETLAFEATDEAGHEAYLVDNFPASDRDFARKRLAEYRMHYPQQQFLSKRQVDAFLERHNLVLAPEFAFAEPIPGDKMRQIENFRLLDQHRFYIDVPMPTQTFYKFHISMEDGEWKMGRGFVEEFRTSLLDLIVSDVLKSFFTIQNDRRVRADCKWEANFGKPLIAVVNQDLALITREPAGFFLQAIGRPAIWSRGYHYEAALVDVVYRVGHHFVRLETFDARQAGATVARRVDLNERWGFGNRIEQQHWMDIDLSIPDRRPNMAGAERCSHDQIYRMVIAPEGMMRDDIPMRVEDRHLVFDPSLSAMGTFHLPDPIVLQPVDLGYLVLAKWGDEAQLPEVQDPGTN